MATDSGPLLSYTISIETSGPGLPLRSTSESRFPRPKPTSVVIRVIRDVNRYEVELLKCLFKSLYFCLLILLTTGYLSGKWLGTRFFCTYITLSYSYKVTTISKGGAKFSMTSIDKQLKEAKNSFFSSN